MVLEKISEVYYTVLQEHSISDHTVLLSSLDLSSGVMKLIGSISVHQIILRE